jgi:transposase
MLLSLRKFFFQKISYTLFLNTLSMIWKNTWKKKVPHFLPNKLKVSSIKFYNHWYFYIQIEFSTEIWNLRTYW